MYNSEWMLYANGLAAPGTLARRAPSRPRVFRGLGDTWDDILSVVRTGGSIAAATPTVLALVQDPAFPELVAQINRIATQDAISNPSAGPAKINLAQIIPIVRAYAWGNENKWIVPILGLAAVGIPFTIGLYIGKRSKKRLVNA